MTDQPAPAPDFPKAYRRAGRLNSSNFALAIGAVALLLGSYNVVSNNDNSTRIAAEARARSELNEAINTRLQAGLCDLLTTVGNPSQAPTTLVGKENTLKFRKSAAIFDCPNQVYTVPSEQLAPAGLTPRQ